MVLVRKKYRLGSDEELRSHRFRYEYWSRCRRRQFGLSQSTSATTERY